MRILQEGPEAAGAILADLVSRTTYKQGWKFELTSIKRGQGCSGTTLIIRNDDVPDSWNPAERTSFLHLMEVPAANYNADDWQRWIYEQILKVETHEAMEFFRVDGEAPFFPSHAPGWDPYYTRQSISRADALGEALTWNGGTPEGEHFA